MGHEWQLHYFGQLAAARYWKFITPEDVTLAISFTLWTIILCLPLKDIDRRDAATKITYVLFCIGAGVVLVLALPQHLLKPPSSANQALQVFGMALIATLRWTLSSRKAQIIGKPIKPKEGPP